MHSGDEDDPSDMFLSSSIAWEGQGIPNSACRNSCVCEGGLDSSVMMEVGGRSVVGWWEDLGRSGNRVGGPFFFLHILCDTQKVRFAGPRLPFYCL
jgi:hypothetical protein